MYSIIVYFHLGDPHYSAVRRNDRELVGVVRNSIQIQIARKFDCEIFRQNRPGIVLQGSCRRNRKTERAISLRNVDTGEREHRKLQVPRTLILINGSSESGVKVAHQTAA